jgi:hypothetical protein
MTACRLRVWGSAYAGATTILLLQQPLDKPRPRNNDIRHQPRKEPDSLTAFTLGLMAGLLPEADIKLNFSIRSANDPLQTLNSDDEKQSKLTDLEFKPIPISFKVPD